MPTPLSWTVMAIAPPLAPRREPNLTPVLGVFRRVRGHCSKDTGPLHHAALAL